MYSPFQIGWRYLRYYFSSYNGKGHGMHSPFVFNFITQVLNDDREFYAYRSIENVRHMLLLNEKEIVVEDMGAGSRSKKSNKRKVCDIARAALKPAKYGQLLFRMAHHYAPETITELGTSLGITTAYLAAACENARVVTLEGTSQIAAIAKSNFNKLGLRNIELVEGNFDNTLLPVLQSLEKVDMVFVDGNHRYEPTMQYFRQMLPYVHESSVVIFDDIHWSSETEKAWEEIVADTSVTLSIDLFFIGIVFFRKEQKVKQHFTIRF